MTGSRFWMLPKGAIILLALPFLLPGSAGAQRGAADSLARSSDSPWRDLTLADIAAAYSIVTRNHPAAVAAAGDSAFRQTLEEARAHAVLRAGRVNSYEGWLGTLRASAVEFRPPHLPLRPRLPIPTVPWPRFVVTRVADATIVASADTN